VDSLESEVASYKEGESKYGHQAEAWESPKQARRASIQQKTARSQGHEDSFGLVHMPGAGRSDDYLSKSEFPSMENEKRTPPELSKLNSSLSCTSVDSIDESRSSKVLSLDVGVALLFGLGFMIFC